MSGFNANISLAGRTMPAEYFSCKRAHSFGAAVVSVVMITAIHSSPSNLFRVAGGSQGSGGNSIGKGRGRRGSAWPPAHNKDEDAGPRTTKLPQPCCLLSRWPEPWSQSDSPTSSRQGDLAED